jgi:hypothetical protein
VNLIETGDHLVSRVAEVTQGATEDGARPTPAPGTVHDDACTGCESACDGLNCLTNEPSFTLRVSWGTTVIQVLQRAGKDGFHRTGIVRKNIVSKAHQRADARRQQSVPGRLTREAHAGETCGRLEYPIEVLRNPEAGYWNESSGSNEWCHSLTAN